MSGHEQGWGQNCTEIAPAIPHINGLSTLLLRLATYTTVAQGLGTTIHYRAVQGVTGTLGAYSDTLYAFEGGGFGGEIGMNVCGVYICMPRLLHFQHLTRTVNFLPFQQCLEVQAPVLTPL